jgi:hypothetical protein
LFEKAILPGGFTEDEQDRLLDLMDEIGREIGRE